MVVMLELVLIKTGLHNSGRGVATGVETDTGSKTDNGAHATIRKRLNTIITTAVLPGEIKGFDLIPSSMLNFCYH